VVPKGYYNIPNLITICRLAGVVLLLVLMLFIDDSSPNVTLNCGLSLAAMGIFTVAMISDIVDGWLARQWKLVSTFGKFIDPLADKVIFLVAMVMMIPLGRIPAWLVCIFLIREVTVTALRGIAIDEGFVIAASRWGKYKSVFISSAVVGLLIHYPVFGIQWRLIGWVFMVPALLFSIGSGLHYTLGFFRRVSSSRAA
jgi:CDP-diacylglycerol---glycerol-3-phosphate 3-phosphatidyltransferase